MTSAANPHGLNEKQAKFVAEYLVDLNGKQAAIRAGYSVNGAEVTASKLLRHPKVSAALAKVQEQQLKRVAIRADDILLELLRLAKSDVRQLFDETGHLKPIHELSDDAAAALSGVEILREKTTVKGTDVFETTVEESVRKIKLWDKPKALEILARHLGLLKDTVHVEGDVIFTLRFDRHQHPGIIDVA